MTDDIGPGAIGRLRECMGGPGLIWTLLEFAAYPVVPVVGGTVGTAANMLYLVGAGYRASSCA